MFTIYFRLLISYYNIYLLRRTRICYFTKDKECLKGQWAVNIQLPLLSQHQIWYHNTAGDIQINGCAKPQIYNRFCFVIHTLSEKLSQWKINKHSKKLQRKVKYQTSKTNMRN